MPKTTSIDSEVDIYNLVLKLWEGRWKIILSAFVAFIATLIYFETVPRKFQARTEIIPITIEEEFSYNLFESIKQENDEKSDDKDTIKKTFVLKDEKFEPIVIDRLLLQDLFIEQLETKQQDLKKIFIKNQLLKREDFENDIMFDKAVIKQIKKIKILSPYEEISKNKRKKNIEKNIFTIEYNHVDKDKWINFLEDLYKFANRNVQVILNKRFYDLVDYKRLKNSYELEDLKIKIKNYSNDYDLTINNRIAYLEEQAAIARELRLSTNRKAIISQEEFPSIEENTIIQLKAEQPLYMRGYEAIEKEISLIKDRSNKEAFITNLLPLKRKIRDIEQDRTIDRAIEFFSSTPISTGENYRAVIFDTSSTDFRFITSRFLSLLQSILVGSVFGIFYIFFSSLIGIRK